MVVLYTELPMIYVSTVTCFYGVRTIIENMSIISEDDSRTMDTAIDINFEYMFKVLMIGNSGVGKTAFVARYCDKHFNPAFMPTVGIDFRVKDLIRYESGF